MMSFVMSSYQILAWSKGQDGQVMAKYAGIADSRGVHSFGRETWKNETNWKTYGSTALTL